MGIRQRVLIEIDSQNMGVINRLYEEGSIYKYTVLERQEEKLDPPKFVAQMRRQQANSGNHRANHGTAPRSPKGVRAVECVLAIMQTKPEDSWDWHDLGMILEADYGYSRNSASATLSLLKQHGYTERVDLSKWKLTEQGRNHSQNDPLEIEYHP